MTPLEAATFLEMAAKWRAKAAASTEAGDQWLYRNLELSACAADVERLVEVCRRERESS